MEERQIVELFWDRSERALSETAKQYGSYCRQIAYNILRSQEDSEECVNDTYLRAWNTIPPQRPDRLSVFLGKITRNLALDRYRCYTAEKRGGGQLHAALEELSDCVPASSSPEQVVETMALTELLDRFLTDLAPVNRKIFLRRYWYVSTIREIAEELGMSESRVKMSLLRSRRQLKELLEKEGVVL